MLQAGQGGSARARPFAAPPLAQDNATWAQLTHINLCYSLPVLVAGHGCSYHCALSAFGDGGGAGEECWLSPKPEGASGSQCPQFPNPEALAPPLEQQQSSAAPQRWRRAPHAALLLALVVAGVLA